MSALRWACVLAVLAGCSQGRMQSAPGVITDMLNQDLAKETARNRALGELSSLLQLDGIRFKVNRSALGETRYFEHQPMDDLSEATFELRPITNGWMAIASAPRPEAVEAALQGMELREAVGVSRSTDVSEAMHRAKEDAFSQLVTSTSAELGEGSHAGALTLSRLSFDLPESLSGTVEVKVHIRGSVRFESPRALDEKTEAEIAEYVVRRHLSGEDYTSGLSAVETFLKRHPDNLDFGLLRAALLLQSEDIVAARGALRHTLRSTNWDGLQDGLDAVDALLGEASSAAVEGLALDTGLVAPPAIGGRPPANVDTAPKADARKGKRKKRRRRRKRPR